MARGLGSEAATLPKPRSRALCLRAVLAAVLALGVVLAVRASGAGEQEPFACAQVSATPEVSEAFAAYCGRCHTAQKLSKSYFGAADAQSAARLEAELAAFLNRHSGCPHRHHEEIAAWLRQLSAPQ